MTSDRFVGVYLGVLGILATATGSPAADPVTYQRDVKPLLAARCVSCHNEAQPRGELDLSTIETILQGGVSGKVVVSGKPMLSLLYTTTAHLEDPHMPQNKPKLPQKELNTLRNWIEGGLLEKEGAKGVPIEPAKIEPKIAKAELPKPRDTNVTATGVMPKTLPTTPVIEMPRAAPITALAASPKAPLIAVAQQSQVLLYHSATRQRLGVFTYPEGDINILRFSRDGSLLIAGGGVGGTSGNVVAFEVETGRRVFAVGQEVDAVLAADISPDNSMVALGGPGKVVKVFTRDGKLQHTLRKHTDWILSVSFSPEGLLLASSDRNSGLLVWEAKSGKEFATLRGHTAAVTGLAWRSNSTELSSCGEDGTVRVWDMHEGKETASWDAHREGALSIDLHGETIISSGRDKRVRTWDLTGKSKGELGTMRDHALRTCFTHDGSKIIAGDWAGELRVWSANGQVEGLVALPVRHGATLRPALCVSPELANLKTKHAELVAEAARLSDAATGASRELEQLTKALADARLTVVSAEAAAAKAKEVVTALSPVIESRSQAAKSAADRAAQAQNVAKAAGAEAEAFQQALQLNSTEIQARIDRAQASFNKAQTALQEKKLLVQFASDTVAKLTANSTKGKSLEQARELERTLKQEEQEAATEVQQHSTELERAKAVREAARKTSNETAGTKSLETR